MIFEMIEYTNVNKTALKKEKYDFRNGENRMQSPSVTAPIDRSLQVS